MIKNDLEHSIKHNGLLYSHQRSQKISCLLGLIGTNNLIKKDKKKEKQLLFEKVLSFFLSFLLKKKIYSYNYN